MVKKLQNIIGIKYIYKVLPKNVRRYYTKSRYYIISNKDAT